jgi:drug/metabolite transporter (DMT)-like permease
MTGNPPREQTQNAARAALWMALAVVSFSLMAVAGREAGRSLPVVDLIFYRSFIALVVILLIMKATSQSFTGLRTRKLGLHFARSAVHFAGQATWLAALMLIPLTEVFALEFTAPLWVALLAPLVLGERLTGGRLATACIGFSGAMVVVRPGFTEISNGTWMAILCAIFFAGAILTTKLLTRTEPPLRVLVYMLGFQAAIALVLSGARLELPSGGAWIWVTAIALASLVAHFSLVSAYRHADALVVAPMDFVRLPLIAVVGIILYAEPPSSYVLLGGSIIIAANALNIWIERARHKQLQAQPARGK